jgi:hypothetical protein
MSERIVRVGSRWKRGRNEVKMELEKENRILILIRKLDMEKVREEWR